MHSDKSVLERLSAARVSDDLSHRPTACDVDCCQASGLAAMRHRVGAALMDVDLTLDRRKIAPALAEVMHVVRKLGKSGGWIVTPVRTRRIAVEALRQYLSAVCGTCKGRGMLGVDRSEADRGKARPCPDCDATGKRAIPGQQTMQRQVRAVLAVLERCRREYAAAVRARLRLPGELD